VSAVWHPDFDLEAALATTPREYLPDAYVLTNPSYWLEGPGATFQGRDVFAPVAAHLANGVSPADLGQPVALESLALLPASASILSPGVIKGRIITCDHFGNLITNIAAGLLPALGPLETLQVTLGSHRLRGVHLTYSAAPSGVALALINSAGLLEIAVRDGNAAQQLDGHIGDDIFCARL